MNIGKRLKIARDALGYTLRTASQRAQIGQSSLSEFENGKREPRFSQLAKLAELYKQEIGFFLTNEPVLLDVMVWRDGPDSPEQRKQVESEFRRLCEQYHKLEVLTEQTSRPALPQPDVTNASEFDFDCAERLAKKVQHEFQVGDVPIACLQRLLQDVYHVKIFYLDFIGSAISTVSEKFGPAILLNARNKQWRRSFDLAHELFHVLTWKVFRCDSTVGAEQEEQLANTFASHLLMPEESVRHRINSCIDDKDRITFDCLDDIAREFDVSLVALLFRIANIFRFGKADTEKYRKAAERYAGSLAHRESHEPSKFPQRYCDLAARSLREGKLSLLQFARYMDLSYRQAESYLMDEEDFTDEKVSITST